MPTKPPRYGKRVNVTATSARKNATSVQIGGVASASNGSSHSENCGDHTLLASRNQATRGRATRCHCWGGSQRTARSSSTAQPTSVTVAPARLRVATSRPAPTQPGTMRQRLSQSAGRSRFSSRKRSHPSGAASATGRFTSAHAPTAVRAVRIPAARPRTVPAPRTTAGRSSAGHNLAAVPSPSHVPAQPSRPRRCATRPAVASASDGRSQLTAPLTHRVGAAANTSVRRTPTVRASSPPTMPPLTTNRALVQPKNAAAVVLGRAASHIHMPVSGGYSTGWSR